VRADFGWPALLPLLVIQGLVTLVVYLVLVVLGAFTMALPSFLMLLNLKASDQPHASAMLHCNMRGRMHASVQQV
jgi:hypothetical protein